MLKPQYSIWFSLHIPNRKYVFPDKFYVISQNITGGDTNKKENEESILEKGKFSFPTLKIALVFNNDCLTYFLESPKGKSEEELKFWNALFNSIANFISFKILLKCDITGPPEIDDQSKIPEKNRINIKSKPANKITKKEIEEFIKITANKEGSHLQKAVSFFLKGSSDPGSFPTNYYKAIESIQDYFGSEKKTIDELKPYGATRIKELKRTINDQMENTLSTGRHTPKNGTKIIHTDARSIFTDQDSHNLFMEQSEICHETIDAFIKYIKKNNI